MAKKGNIPWNKGKKITHSGSFKKGYDPKRIVQKKGEKHYLWKGEDASYSPKHKWVVKMFGKASKCEDCGKTEGLIDWANISQEYMRVKEDWKQLCRKCHFAFDYEGIMEKRKIKKLEK